MESSFGQRNRQTRALEELEYVLNTAADRPASSTVSHERRFTLVKKPVRIGVHLAPPDLAGPTLS